MTDPYYVDDQTTVFHGDALEVLRGLPAASVDAVVTDPPYGLEFMGQEWDRFAGKVSDRDFKGFVLSQQRTRNVKCPDCGKWAYDHPGRLCECGGVRRAQGSAFQQWCDQWAAECLRVLKPGGHLLAFGGTRTVHRLTCGIEDAGFEIRDGIDWIYGSGFPKSRNLDGAWSGWGTALKPAREPIVVARKPLAGTVAANVLEWGTGALNIDACRVGDHERTNNAGGSSSLQRISRVEQGYRSTVTASVGEASTVVGRWPTNVVFTHSPDCADDCTDGCPVAELDAQSGTLSSGANPTRRSSDKFRDAYGDFAGQAECTPARGADSGGASRFFPVFRYEAKAPTAERPRTADGTAHPTVKPLELMRWLVRLVTPPGGTVLDPFAGSGTTAEACVVEGFRCITIERDATYLPLIDARLGKGLQPVLDILGLDGAA